jgi:hypothetical protein
MGARAGTSLHHWLCRKQLFSAKLEAVKQDEKMGYIKTGISSQFSYSAMLS